MNDYVETPIKDIQLSRQARRILKDLNKSKIDAVSDTPAAQRLSALKLIEVQDDTFAAKITDRGKDYLLYRSDKFKGQFLIPAGVSIVTSLITAIITALVTAIVTTLCTLWLS